MVTAKSPSEKLARLPVRRRLVPRIKPWQYWYAATLKQLLMRLETALGKAYEEEIFIDEINHGPDDRI